MPCKSYNTINAFISASAWGRLAQFAGGFLLAVILGLPSTAALAANLRIGLTTEVNTLDPMFDATHLNQEIARHIFNPLVMQDPQQRLHPGLAVSWRLSSPTVWEFKLRPNVKFHDGSEFSADDVVYSIWRVSNVPNAVSSYVPWISQIASTRVVDRLTLEIETKAPAPTLLNDLSVISIVSKKSAEGKNTADFNSGAATIGTGPYKFVEWIKGDRLTLERNPDYWGGIEPWERVTFRPITSDATRTAALLAGDVDMINQVPSENLERIRGDARFTVIEVPSTRLIYGQLDVGRDVSPGVTDLNGKPLPSNPLKDVRVRRAIDRAINRTALTKQLLGGQAVPAGQMAIAGFFGASNQLGAIPYDPDGAKKLLAEAGYPNGFGLTVASTNNRYPKDDQVVQAIAQMLTRIGIVTKVETMPFTLYASRANKLEFSFMIAGNVLGNGDSAQAIRTLALTFDQKRGYGTVNRGRYSSAVLDKLFDDLSRELDLEKRQGMIARAHEIIAEDVGVISLYHLTNNWALRRELTYEGYHNEDTLAMSVRNR